MPNFAAGNIKSYSLRTSAFRMATVHENLSGVALQHFYFRKGSRCSKFSLMIIKWVEVQHPDGTVECNSLPVVRKLTAMSLWRFTGVPSSKYRVQRARSWTVISCDIILTSRQPWTNSQLHRFYSTKTSRSLFPVTGVTNGAISILKFAPWALTDWRKGNQRRVVQRMYEIYKKSQKRRKTKKHKPDCPITRFISTLPRKQWILHCCTTLCLSHMSIVQSCGEKSIVV